MLSALVLLLCISVKNFGSVPFQGDGLSAVCDSMKHMRIGFVLKKIDVRVKLGLGIIQSSTVHVIQIFLILFVASESLSYMFAVMI